ncbi:MAG: acyl-CoA dehydrogenase family protein [bacterium]|nr:acyl-CoA dehydrogenase family protein [bacterium]
MSKPQTLSKTLATQFATRADQADKQGKLPPEDIAALKSSGYLALNISKQYGGLNASFRDCIEAQLELAQGSSSTALVAAMQPPSGDTALEIIGQHAMEKWEGDSQ